MCGIMGYVGTRPAKNIIINGLRQLEYRGYDSVGVALQGKDTVIVKTVGDTSKLDDSQLPDRPHTGIGHTRWATHGKPSVTNAHPHQYGAVCLVHNGIIENYEQLKTTYRLRKLKGQTDSEVLAGVIDHHLTKTNNLLAAVKQTLLETEGTFGIAVMSVAEPGNIIVARRGSPIVIGVDDGQHYIASDASAIINHTDKVVFLEDDQMALVRSNDLEVYDLKLERQKATIETLETNTHELHHNGFDSHLEKEIFEQPESLANVMRGRITNEQHIMLGGPQLDSQQIRDLKHILIIGCGTAYYAGHYAKYQLEQLLRLPVSVEHASEFRYRYGAYDTDNTLAIMMSQSGETADTLASLEEAKRRGIKTIGIVNSVGSTIARSVSNGGIYLHAGVESSVASTKAYSSMVTALLMLGGFLANKRGENLQDGKWLANELSGLGDQIAKTLANKRDIDHLATKLVNFRDWYFLGRGSLYPVAQEGALKMTEVAYIHAQAFPTGEMKHGPIALIDHNHLSIVLLPNDELLYKKSVSGIEEIKARGGQVLTISSRTQEPLSDFHIQIPTAGTYTEGLVLNVCLQLLTLAIATIKGYNIDRPRNLAKSVTVE